MANVLGLDIRSHSVRGVLAKVTSRAVVILRYTEERVLPSTSLEGARAATRDAIVSMVGTLGGLPERVVSRVPGAQVSIRTVPIPQAAVRRAHEVLPFELDALLPFDAQEAVIDHQPIRTHDGEVELLVAVTPRGPLEAHLALFQDTPLTPREVGAGAMVLDGLAAVPGTLPTGGITVLLDAGGDQTEVCALRDGVCFFARSLPETMEDARTGQLATALQQTLASLRATVGAPIEHVLLCGEAAADGHAAGWFAEKLGLTVTRLVLPDAPGCGEDVRPRFAVAAALAAGIAIRGKRVNLRRGEFAAVQTAGELRRHARLFAVAGACVLAAFAFSLAMRWMSIRDEHAALSDELLKVTERAFGEGVSSPAEARALLGGGAGGSPIPGFDAYDALSALSDRIPADITHDVRKLSIELDDDGQTGRFELRGTVPSIADRDRIAAEIGRHECFQEVQKGTTSAAPGGTGIAYPLEVTLRCPGTGGGKTKGTKGGTDDGAP